MDGEKKWFSGQLNNKKLQQKLEQIKLVITDVDGCLTDCSIAIDEQSGEQKKFNIKDGFIIAHSIKSSTLQIGIASARKNNSTILRARQLGIPNHLCSVGVQDKKKIVSAFIKQTHRSKHEVLFFGDDLYDIDTKDSVGVFACPHDAVFYVKHYADIICPLEGGKGALRLLIDLILYIQKTHPAQDLIKKIID